MSMVEIGAAFDAVVAVIVGARYKWAALASNALTSAALLNGPVMKALRLRGAFVLGDAGIVVGVNQ